MERKIEHTKEGLGFLPRPHHTPSERHIYVRIRFGAFDLDPVLHRRPSPSVNRRGILPHTKLGA